MYTEHNDENLDKSKKDSSDDTSSGTKNIYKFDVSSIENDSTNLSNVGLHDKDRNQCVCIYSFNSRGFSEEKQELCRVLMVGSENNAPILCNQENFLLHGNRRKVKQCLPNSRIFFKKAVKDSLNRGRARNGMFIAVPMHLKDHVKDVSPDHWRVQAIVLSTSKSKILIINSYFPTDPKLKEFDTDDLFSTLSVINDTMKKNDFDSVIWAGDINADFARLSTFTRFVDEFVSEKSLLKSWDSYSIDFTHVLEIDKKTYVSTLDHFFWSENISKSIVDAGVLHLPINTSDHCPVYCKINVNSLPKTNASTPPEIKPKICWSKASVEQKEVFSERLDTELTSIKLPTHVHQCNDVHCNVEEHTDAIDDFLGGMLQCRENCAKECLPLTSVPQRKHKTCIPLWKEDVQPYKDKSIFWHSVWESAGRPLNTELHRIMKKNKECLSLSD